MDIIRKIFKDLFSPKYFPIPHLVTGIALALFFILGKILVVEMLFPIAAVLIYLYMAIQTHRSYVAWVKEEAERKRLASLGLPNLQSTMYNLPFLNRLVWAIILLGLVALYHNQNSDSHENGIVNSNKPSSLQSRDSVQIKNYYGVWMNDSLYQEMLITKSPYASRHYLDNERYLFIGDTNVLCSRWRAIVYNRAIAMKNTVALIKENSDSIFLNLLNDSTIQYFDPECGRTIMRRFNLFNPYFPYCTTSLGIYDDAFFYYLKNKYFKGMHKLTMADYPKESYDVKFQTSCDVRNLLHYTHYEIAEDRGVDTLEKDLLLLDSMKVKWAIFHFKILSDTIYLYNNSNSQDKNIARGKLMYILTRQ